MSELLRETEQKSAMVSAFGGSISPVDAVRLLVNTAVLMKENEPDIDVRSVTESKRGPGILIWIPGYIDNGGTIITADEEPHEEKAGELS
jgi:hypothetical protein